ncbi:MAG: exodeoxyribonuclease VII large subunit [Anaerostipes sp.]|uniref:exodeoxyribonuclease VII large subunit n=1 Tax=Anaerostipes sp. 992a TaxID=1261637 RepID=UPI000951118A|nr:exodeoxyribonuclease VII large subunit [Anaerostipes sp. 992a]MCI5952865.1 exodeoxyribonuclease VII large subunit [Anaerostipes sp.]MDD5969529.1 exodeoxyribonuclease VII large subunit [Anaerostipes sp.]OLR63908.1 exodeoxyribonuclease VII large subunit [Anaerostipes sp. 992a]
MKRVYSVSQINAYIRRMFTSDYALNHIYIKGEVSNCKYHSSGHIYFSIKDAKSTLSCVMFANARRQGLKFRMENGQTVVVGGNINVFERDGSYQLYASEIILDGVGVLYEEYERLKMKLYEEGLFDHEKKKAIPKNPKKVGIVTARTGAAIQDIVSIAKRRNPFVQLILYPAKVQGEGAGLSVARGIQVLDGMELDTIIIGRGGGSIEDLWGFNEEVVARAIYEAKTPIISGTGHETDNTIADYAADLRAATPSAACELAIPDVREIMAAIEGYRYQIQKWMDVQIASYQHRVEQYRIRINLLSPKNQLKQQQMQLIQLQNGLEAAIQKKTERYAHKLELYIQKLHGLSPSAKLTGGYGYITGQDGSPLRSVEQAQMGEKLSVYLSDGKIQAQIMEIQKEDAGKS